MKDNDLSAAPTPRYWVTADVVFIANTTVTKWKTGFLTKARSERTTYTPDLRTLSMLWRWSSSLGCRMELIFFGDMTKDAAVLWSLLDTGASNPFNDYLVYGSINKAVEMLPYRPDLLGVIDQPERLLVWGGRGLTVENLR